VDTWTLGTLTLNVSAPIVANQFAGQTIVVYDASNSNSPSVRTVVSNDTGNIVVDSAFDFTPEASDVIRIYQGSSLDASEVRSAIGMAAANLDTQLSTISGSDATLANQTAMLALLNRMAAPIIGTCTGARTGTEIFVYGSWTMTSINDSSGNRSSVTFVEAT
jgi:3-hydroxyisobutyrate dehydrogenase-like beta-hydroxyacid dehydrogenase